MTEYHEYIQKDSATIPADLPRHIIQLARAIAHQCSKPGVYEIRYTVPVLEVLPVSLNIGKRESMLIREFDR